MDTDSVIDVDNVDIEVDMEPVTNETLAEDKLESVSTSKETPNQKQKFVRLPLARVKAMMKKDPDCGLLSQDAIFLVTKATEMFIEFMAEESGKHLAKVKRKTVMQRDIESVIRRIPNLCFLDGALE